MNGKRAKAVRRAVYGDASMRQRNYFIVAGEGQLVSDGLRSVYQQAKKREAEKPC